MKKTERKNKTKKRQENIYQTIVTKEIVFMILTKVGNQKAQ